MQTSITPLRIHKSDIKRSLLIKMDIWGFTHYFTSCNVTTVHTSNLSSSQRWSCSSYGVFFELTKVESSDQEGNDTQVSFNTYTNTNHHNKKNNTKSSVILKKKRILVIALKLAYLLAQGSPSTAFRLLISLGQCSVAWAQALTRGIIHLSAPSSLHVAIWEPWHSMRELFVP